jgi:hypothetical protein
MTESGELEAGRVKPCLACEELFDFELSYCPSCGTLATPVDGSEVPHDQRPPGTRGTFDAVVVVATAALAALGVIALLVTVILLS